MVFYEIGEKITEIKTESINEENITAGYVNSAELPELSERFGFASETVEACKQANPMFRTDVEVHDGFTFTELRIVNGENDDWIGVFLKKNFILVVDINDKDESTKTGFINTIKRLPSSKIRFEKIVSAFFDSLISGDNLSIESMRNTISEMEETVVSGKAGNDFNRELLNVKKLLLRLHNYYEQIIDVTETLEENENDILEDEYVFYISNLINKVTRLKDDVDSLINSADHVQDAYSSFLDMRLNNTMKFFTVLTSIFFPLTIIVGWYGMNFESMPEFKWRFGYLYVILLSVIVVAVFTLAGKRKKWF